MVRCKQLTKNGKQCLRNQVINGYCTTHMLMSINMNQIQPKKKGDMEL